MGLVVMKADNPIPSMKKKKLNWLGHDVEAMRRAVEMCNLDRVPQTVRKVLEAEAWREPEKHEGGCGWKPKYVALALYRKAVTAPVGANQHTKVGSDNVTIQPKRGNDLAYTVERLERERKDLFDKVCAGELSANAAAIAAGFRKKPTPLDQVRRLWSKATEVERAAIREWIENACTSEGGD